MNRTHAFNVMFDPEDKARLAALSADTGYSKGQCLRDALKYAWLHRCRNVPTCANGRTCYVPQMHTDGVPATGAPSVAPAFAPAPTGV